MHAQMVATHVTALIFLPAYLSLESVYAEQCITYVLERGYRLAGVLRDWGEIDRQLRAGQAGLVVVARVEHAGADPAAATGERTTVIRPSVASARCRVPSAGHFREVDAYRAGYADGFVDSLTIASSHPN